MMPMIEITGSWNPLDQSYHFAPDGLIICNGFSDFKLTSLVQSNYISN